jgi:hypothetical protein
VPAVLVSAAAGVPVAVSVMMPAAAAVLVMLVPLACAVFAAALMLMFVFVVVMTALVVFMFMLVLVMAALAVFMLVLVLVFVVTALAVLMFMLVLVTMLAHKNLRKIQWLLKYSTIRSKENARLFAQMIQPEVQDLFDVFIRKGIEHVLSLPAEPDEVRKTQRLQLMRDRGLRHSQKTCEIAHAKLVHAKRLHDPHARSIAKQLKKRGKVDRLVTVQKLRAYRIHNVLMDGFTFAYRQAFHSFLLFGTVEQLFNYLYYTTMFAVVNRIFG